jgi:hypothetical protein
MHTWAHNHISERKQVVLSVLSKCPAVLPQLFWLLHNVGPCLNKALLQLAAVHAAEIGVLAWQGTVWERPAPLLHLDPADTAEHRRLNRFLQTHDYILLTQLAFVIASQTC